MATSARALWARGARYLRRRGISEPARETMLILERALDIRSNLGVIHHDLVVSRDAEQRFLQILGQRGRRVPWAYLVSQREFWSRPFFISPAVLVPRPETEILVEAVLDLAAGDGEDSVIVDVGTGSGVIAVTLALELPRARIYATDSSPAALSVARENARIYGLCERVQFVQGDLLGPVAGRGRIQMVVSNPPYIAAGQYRRTGPEVRLFEPPRALVAGNDGLFFIRRLLRQAPHWLTPGGALVIEIGWGQRPAVDGILCRSGDWENWSWHRDLSGIDRVLVAHKGGGKAGSKVGYVDP